MSRPSARSIAAAIAFAFSTQAAAADITREQASLEVKELAPYRVMAEHYPAEYEKMLSLLVKEARKGRSVREVALDNNAVITELVERQIPKANMDNALRNLSFMIVGAKAAMAVKPKYCLAVLGVAKSDRPFAEYLPSALEAENLSMTAELLRQTATAPEPPPPPTAGMLKRKLAENAYFSLPSEPLSLAFRETRGEPSRAITMIQQEAFCRVSVRLLEQILSMPPAEAAATFKSAVFD